jgi:RecJ-like exonuclease
MEAGRGTARTACGSGHTHGACVETTKEGGQKIQAWGKVQEHALAFGSEPLQSDGNRSATLIKSLEIQGLLHVLSPCQKCVGRGVALFCCTLQKNIHEGRP